MLFNTDVTDENVPRWLELFLLGFGYCTGHELDKRIPDYLALHASGAAEWIFIPLIEKEPF